MRHTLLSNISRPLHATIDLSALSHNVARIQSFTHRANILAMIKANAYGHGMTPIAKQLSGVNGFGVACLEEARTLIEAGITQPIFLMEGPFSVEALSVIAKHDFHIVLHHPAQIDMLVKTPCNTPLNVWLKLETGMHRLGFSATDFLNAWQRLQDVAWVKKPINLMTHFAQADDVASTLTQRQYDLFKHITKEYPGQRSCANSAATLGYKHMHEDWIRPGIILYGISPFADKTGSLHGLKPVMTLRSKIIALNHVPKGEQVGYGAGWIAPRDSRIAVVAIGYGDGYPRHAPNGTPVLINGKKMPLAGHVSMDMLTVDVSDEASIKIGDEVVLWGNALPIETIAKYVGTIPYELTCNITARVKFLYI